LELMVVVEWLAWLASDWGVVGLAPKTSNLVHEFDVDGLG